MFVKGITIQHKTRTSTYKCNIEPRSPNHCCRGKQ